MVTPLTVMSVTTPVWPGGAGQAWSTTFGSASLGSTWPGSTTDPAMTFDGYTGQEDVPVPLDDWSS